MNLVIIFFRLVFNKKVVRRGLHVALVVGVILNLINQGNQIISLDFSQMNFIKFILTFIVPYLVSSYSSVMAKLNFEVGEIAPMNAILKCKKCEDAIIHVNKGEVIPECKMSISNTKWRIVERGVANPKIYDDKAQSMALFAEFNPAPVFRFDPQGTVLVSNPAADQFFGKESIEGRDVHQLLKEFVSYDFKKIIDKGEILSFVVKIQERSMRFQLRGIPKLGVCQVYGADVSEVLEIKLENLRLSEAIEQTSNSIMITDNKGDITFVNKAFEKTTGYTISEVLGKNPRFLKTDNLVKEDYENMWNALADGKVWKGEFHNRKKNNETYWEEAIISPIRDEFGSVVNFMAVKEDVTERKKARFELRSMAQFAELNPEPVFRLDKNGVVLKANLAANSSFRVDSIEGMTFLELLPNSTTINLNNVIKNGEILTIEESVESGVFRFILRGLPEFNVCQIYGSDVTMRRKAEEEVKKQNEHIEQSIRYASRIQNAVLPNLEFIRELMSEYFVLFKPRDIVSGDFYWTTRKNNKLIIAAADCTGHGVPGAFMSMLGIALLNEIVNKNKEEKASEILNQLRANIKVTLSQTSNYNSAKDGMDIALCVIDYDTMTMQYAGAYNPLIIIRDNEMIQYKADKMPIGVHLREKATFTNHEIKIIKNDCIYMYSDGFPDQFGGEKDNKFSSKRFKELLMIIHSESFEKQKQMLDDKFIEWKGRGNQIDDVLVFGGKI